eukprot:scaffold98231_cov33-Prasinocladus_malaysianus.AAC.1
MNADRGFGLFEMNRTMIHFKYFSADQDKVIDEFVVCAVPGCNDAPYAPPSEWPVKTDGGETDEQHILPPPSPPMPPMEPPSPPSPPLAFTPGPEDEEPDYDQDGNLILEDSTEQPEAVEDVPSTQEGQPAPEEPVENGNNTLPGHQEGLPEQDREGDPANDYPIFDGSNGAYYAPAQQVHPLP